MGEEIYIRANSVIKLASKGGANYTMTFPKTCKVEHILREVLRAEFINKGEQALRDHIDDQLRELRKTNQ